MSLNTAHFEPLPSLDTSVFVSVIKSERVGDRLALTRQLCGLVNDPNTSSADRKAVMPCLARLACDVDRDVRSIIAKELVACEHLSVDLIFAVVADEDDIALPFLAACPSVDATVMMAVLSVGDQKRCTIIAKRADVSASVVKKIMNDGTEDTVLALLENSAVRLGAGYCRTAYNKFHTSHRICSALLKLPHLPAEIALVHNQRKANEMRKAASLQGWVADSRSDDYISDQEETNALRIVAGVEARELEKIVSLMSQRSMLTTSLLLRAGIHGQLSFFEWALAYLANVSMRRVRAATQKMSSRTLNSLLRRAGIPSDAHALMQAICEVASATGSSGKSADADAFGRAMVEVIMTRHAADDPHERENIIALLIQLTDGRTRKLVSRIAEGLSRVA